MGPTAVGGAGAPPDPPLDPPQWWVCGWCGGGDALVGRRKVKRIRSGEAVANYCTVNYLY